MNWCLVATHNQLESHSRSSRRAAGTRSEQAPPGLTPGIPPLDVSPLGRKPLPLDTVLEDSLPVEYYLRCQLSTPSSPGRREK